MPGHGSSEQRRKPPDGYPARKSGTTPSSLAGAMQASHVKSSTAEPNLEGLMEKINSHLRNHDAKTSEECHAVMSGVENSLESLMDKHFSADAEPARVSEMLLFHVMFSGQQYLECEHAQLVFGEGGARAVSYPVRKLCALLPIPRLASLHPRILAHIVLLASLWLPRDASSLVDFFQDVVELLQNLERLWRIVEEKGGDNVLVAGTRVVAFARLGKALGQPPLDLELPSRIHLSLCRASLTSVAAKIGTLMPMSAAGSCAYTQLWSLLSRQLASELRPETEAFHHVSLEALLELLQDPPLLGAMPQLGVNCLYLAGRALEAPQGFNSDQVEEGEGASNKERRAVTPVHLPAIQDLSARCLRAIFPSSSLHPTKTRQNTPGTRGAGGAGEASAAEWRGQRQPRGWRPSATGTASTRANLPPAESETAAAACLASASATLPCITRWWAGCQQSVSNGGGDGGGTGTAPHTEEATVLAKAIAAAYASAVKCSGERSARGKSRPTTAVAAGTSAGSSRKFTTAAQARTPRRKSGDTPRGRDAGTPSFGVGLTTPRR
ncbi:unnamed protein product, partial [Scytosiphon promiscuus]